MSYEQFSEDSYEQALIELFQSLEGKQYRYEYGPNIVESPGQVLDSSNELGLIPTIQDCVFIHLRIILVDIHRNAMRIVDF